MAYRLIISKVSILLAAKTGLLAAVAQCAEWHYQPCCTVLNSITGRCSEWHNI